MQRGFLDALASLPDILAKIDIYSGIYIRAPRLDRALADLIYRNPCPLRENIEVVHSESSR